MPITPTCGRIVHVYSVQQWGGPRPGIILDVKTHESGAFLCDVKVFLNGAEDGAADTVLRGLQVYAPMNGQMRDEGTWGPYWCEWMIYQAGQAAKNDDDIGALRDRVEALEKSVGGIRN